MLSINLPGKTVKPDQERSHKGWENMTSTFGFVLQAVYISSSTTKHYHMIWLHFPASVATNLDLWLCSMI